MAANAQQLAEKSQHILQKENEFRFEVEHGSTVKLKLKEGIAEIWGVEMAPQRDYTFRGGKYAVFTWSGCTLELSGTCPVQYVSNETPMTTYLNMHLALETLRQKRASEGKPGPMVFIVGPTDVGKSTLSQILINYAARSGGRPIFADLDLGQGNISVPATIGAICVEKVMDIEEGYISMPPYNLFFGHESPGKNPKVFNQQVGRLAATVKARMERDPKAKQSGCIINTCGWVDGLGYQLLLHAFEVFGATTILVIGHERLCSDIAKKYQNTDVSVIKLAKSGGVVQRDQAFRRETRSIRIREYFYGIKGDLSPYSTLVHFSEVEIYRISDGVVAPTSALPIGQNRKVDETQLTRITPNNSLLHAVLALSSSSKTDSVSLIESNAIGFIFVTEVDEQRQCMNVLAPSPGKLPRNILVMGSLRWIESKAASR